MAKSQRFFQKFIFLVVILIIVQYNDAKLDIKSSHFFPFNFEQIKYDLFSKSDFAINKKISESNSRNWTEHHQCLMELNAIKNGLKNFEPWAFTLIDAWGKIPSGISSGNFMEFGSFSQCFSIKRNDQVYETRYCLAHLTFQSDELVAMFDKNLFIKPPSNFPQVTTCKPGFSFGICFPAVCPVEHLQTMVDELVNTRISDISIKISNDFCQREKEAKKLETKDVIAIVFATIILILVSISTGYDLICTKYSHIKYPPYLTFSFYTNGKKLFAISKSSDSTDAIQCLHGIRVLSTQWIVFGHICLMYGLFPIQNKATLTTLSTEIHSVIIFGAPISVDTFFVLSGLLVSINVLKQLEKNGKINLWLLYAHRYLRLTPLMSACVLLSTSLMRFMGSGPMWPYSMEYLRQSCKRYWWSTLLYIQNYVNPHDMCMMHTWSLNCDMQLFIIAPLIVYMIYRFKMKTVFALVGLVLGCIFTTLAVHIQYGLKSLRTEGKMELAYFPTHIRFSSWLIGVIAGYIFFKTRQRSFQIPKMLNIFAWIISLTIMVTVICSTYSLEQLDSEIQPIQYGLYDGLSRVCWSIALCYIIFACAHNAGGPVNRFLSHRFWQPLSRLCYSIYLVHVPVLIAMTAAMKVPFYFTYFSLLQNIVFTYILTMLVATIAALVFESPTITIEKMILSTIVKFDNQNGTNEAIKMNGKNGTVQRNDLKEKHI